MTDGFRERGAAPTRLEAFVDAAFAFAVTLLIISVGTMPDSIDGLLAALRGVPAFAASFAILAWVWRGHANWSLRFGLDDALSSALALVLVFLVLVFVYPLRMLFASAFHALSGGALPAGVAVRDLSDLQWLYWVYAGAFGLLGGVLLLLYVHAWRQREHLELDHEERVRTRVLIASWAWVPAVALLSALLAGMLPLSDRPSFVYGLPGMSYCLLGLQWPVLVAYERRLRARAS